MEETSPSFMGKYKFTIISLFIIALAAIPLLLLSNSAKFNTKPQQTAQSVTPTPEALTPSNTDAALVQEQTSLDQTLNQVDVDLQAASKVDASQDTTSGL